MDFNIQLPLWSLKHAMEISEKSAATLSKFNDLNTLHSQLNNSIWVIFAAIVHKTLFYKHKV